MSFLLRRLVRTVAQRVAFDPQARDTAAKTGQGIVAEARSIARNKDPARAAGRSFRRALGKLQQAAEADRSHTDDAPPSRDDKR